MRTMLACLWIGLFTVCAHAQMMESRLPFPTFAQTRTADFWGNNGREAATHKFAKGGPNYGKRAPLILVAVEIGTAIMDVEGNQHCQAIGTCAEGNFFMPSSRGGQYVVKAALIGLATFTSFAWRRAGPFPRYRIRNKFWFLPETEMIGVNVAGFATSLQYWYPKGQ
jgi:hypothetical protein